MQTIQPKTRGLVLCVALIALLSAGDANAATVDPCALPGVALASGDGIGGTGYSEGDDGVGGTGHSGDDDDGIGGTGYSGDDDGIGGTGLAHHDGIGGTGDDDGIGGTGLSDNDGIGGTGIWGTITNFGSLCVNGLRVQYDEQTSILRNGKSADANALERGQVVWIEATAQGTQLRANRIAAVSAIIGPLTAIDTNTRILQLGEQTVAVPKGVIWAGVPPLDDAKFARLRPGDTLDVSGLRDDEGTIVATRIVRSEAALPSYRGPRLAALIRESDDVKQLSIEGFRGRENAQGQFRVGGLEVKAPRMRRLTPFSRVWVNGPRSGAESMDARRVLYRPLQRDSSRGPAAEAASLWREQIGENDGPQVIESGSAPELNDSRTLPVAVSSKAQVVERAPSADPRTAPAARVSDAISKPQPPERARPTERPPIDRPPKLERPPKIERPQKIERPPKIERPQTIERPPTIERAPKLR